MCHLKHYFPPFIKICLFCFRFWRCVSGVALSQPIAIGRTKILKGGISTLISKLNSKLSNCIFSSFSENFKIQNLYVHESKTLTFLNIFSTKYLPLTVVFCVINLNMK